MNGFRKNIAADRIPTAFQSRSRPSVARNAVHRIGIGRSKSADGGSRKGCGAVSEMMPARIVSLHRVSETIRPWTLPGNHFRSNQRTATTTTKASTEPGRSSVGFGDGEGKEANESTGKGDRPRGSFSPGVRKGLVLSARSKPCFSSAALRSAKAFLIAASDLSCALCKRSRF